MGLEEKICVHKLLSKKQMESGLKKGEEYYFLFNKKIPAGCMSYFEKGCYSCKGKENDRNSKCGEYYILQQ
jgi:hypothetical protein